ncbi:hypothetical protein HHK36_017049 [Tetracentron sinense]|uniref:Uncharacterized protein n=1 Tax=Tetracentron sinense TaxID=13715 RepID=A0A834YY76_TETSI|nr:hypothetical protein HHK36_017049 [Tetracentron sinense]
MTTSTAMGTSIVQLECPSRSNLIYDMNFYGNHIQTIITRAPHIFNSCIVDIEKVHRWRLKRLVVGLDVEVLADFSGYKIEYPATTIQICVSRNCLIFHNYHARRVLRSLFQFFSNPNYTFTGVAISDDAKKL